MSRNHGAFADRRLRELDPRPSPLPAALVRARAGLARSTPLFLSIPDPELEREWGWTGEGEGDIRSAFYIAMQAFESAAGQVTRSLAGSAVGPAAGSIGAATEARWDLHGLLASLADGSLDSDPGGGQWTIRRTLAHVISSQRAYAWFSAWWMSRQDAPDYPLSVPDDLAEQFDADISPIERLSEGSLPEVRARLDAFLDLSRELWLESSEDDLSVRARWMGFPVTTGFRVGRWSTHIQEHTVQVEKTLALLGQEPSEVERMVRLLYRAFGRMESAAWVVGRGGDETAESEPPAQRMEVAIAEVEEIAAGVVEAAARR